MVVNVTTWEHRAKLCPVVPEMVHVLELVRRIVLAVKHQAVIQAALPEFAQVLLHQIRGCAKQGDYHAVCRQPFLDSLLEGNRRASPVEPDSLLPKLLDSLFAWVNAIIQLRTNLRVMHKIAVPDSDLEDFFSLKDESMDFAITSISWLE